MDANDRKCEREHHDFYGQEYDKCPQCSIRDNGPWEYNPWLEDVRKSGWTPDQKHKHMMKEMSRKQRRLYDKYLKRGMNETDAALKALEG